MIQELGNNLSNEVKTIIITVITTVLTVLITYFIKYVYDKHSLEYKLSREYTFLQKKLIKEEIAKHKICLLNSCEELNYRLWNFTVNINKGWHNISETEIQNQANYYLHSFVYRFLSLYYWIFKIDESIISFDSTIADRKDIEYLKFIKTIKNMFCDTLLLESFNYDTSTESNHFFKDNFYHYIGFVKNNEGIISYNSYLKKLKTNIMEVQPIIKYIVNIKDDMNNINYTILKEFHIILLVFLNLYGHDYQKTEHSKIKSLVKDTYKAVKNKDEFENYIIRCKLNKELKKYMEMLNFA
jgi:uncharacterized protein YbdZ (MbtH family)